MAIDSNDQQVTSEMSRRFEHFSLNDQEGHDAYESEPIGDYWLPESTYPPDHYFDSPVEPNVKSVFYIPDPMHDGAVFDRIPTIQDTTDIGSEGSSVYPGPASRTSVNGMDWPFPEVGVTVSISDL